MTISGPHGRQHARPGNPASAVYGTVLAAGQLAVQSDTGLSGGRMIVSLTATLVVFWIVHAYTDTLGTVIADGREGALTLRHGLRAEWPIVESGLLPVLAVALTFYVLGATSQHAALAALLVAVAELAGWAALAARRAKLDGLGLLLYTVLVTLLGVALVGLKYAIH